MKIWISTAGWRRKKMGRSLLIIGVGVLMLVGSPSAQQATLPDDMEFIEFLGTFDKDVDPLMLSNMSKLKNVPPTSAQRRSSYEKKNTKQEDDADE